MLATLALVPALLAACAGAAPDAPAPARPSGPTGPVAQAVVENSQLWPGRDDVLFDVVDEDWNGVDVGPERVKVVVRDPSGALRDHLIPERLRMPGTGQRLFRARVTLDTPGTWQLEVRTDVDGSLVTSTTELVVSPDDGRTPAIGAPVPDVDTPVATDDAGIAAISSVASPPPALYAESARRALADGRPFLLVIDTASFPTSDACGGAIGHVLHLATEFPDLLMIHAEPYRTTIVDGRLALADPAAGPELTPEPAPWAIAWGATSPPWVFVVDANGHLAAKFSGVMGTDELRAAILAVEPAP
ncbi:MAG: hypothetical protein U0869_22630 [Chloroflexota bacterium]